MALLFAKADELHITDIHVPHIYIGLFYVHLLSIKHRVLISHIATILARHDYAYKSF